jgi:hypothetical protein
MYGDFSGKALRVDCGHSQQQAKEPAAKPYELFSSCAVSRAVNSAIAEAGFQNGQKTVGLIVHPFRSVPPYSS